MSEYITSKWYVYDKKEYLKKSCPFCGGKASIFYFEELVEESSNFYYGGEEVCCENCGAGIREYNSKASHTPEIRISMRKKIKDRWNRRCGGSNYGDSPHGKAG